jgi:thiamine pyrophosphate-dependent acetolactate synthase large subunit-like protein
MSGARLLERSAAAVSVARWAATYELPLFVGNGFLLRDVVANADRESNFYLFGGMGLAAAVACGFLQAAAGARAGGAAAVLEGDGNFYMGFCAALHAAASRLRLAHFVYDNGVYESSGSQPVPWDALHRLDELAPALGYAGSASASTDRELDRLLRDLEPASLPMLVWLRGEPSRHVSPRPTFGPVETAVRFSAWARRSAASAYETLDVT